MRLALIFAKMCRVCKTMVLHVYARCLSVTKEGKWRRSGMSCVLVVLFSEWHMWKMGTSCDVYKHRLGRMWS
jgi:hypothetical protein